MNFIKKYVFILMLCFFDICLAPGAGIYFIRRTSEGSEILFVCDPYQQSKERHGFEHPGGGIGDDSSDYPLALQNPKTFLRGGLREAFEETACTIALLMKNKGLLHTKYVNPYCSVRKKGRKTYEINKNFMNDALNAAEQQILEQGLAYVFKPHIFNEKSKIKDRNVVFFWDITDISDDNLPQTIVNHRMKYKKEKSDLNLAYDLHAEPVAFAWVRVTELQKVLHCSTAQWVPVAQYAEHHPYANYSVSLEQSRLTVPLCKSEEKTVVTDAKNKKVLLSEVCIKMMRDRVGNRYNHQDDTGCIHKQDGTCITICGDNIKKEDTLTVQDSSSMRSIIRGLQQRSKDSLFN